MATAQISKQQIISALKQIQEEIKTTDEKLKDTSFFHALECLRMALVTEKTVSKVTMPSVDHHYEEAKHLYSGKGWLIDVLTEIKTNAYEAKVQ